MDSITNLINISHFKIILISSTAVGVKDLTVPGPFSPNYTMEAIESYRLVMIDRWTG